MFYHAYPVEYLKPAPYNPRIIDDAAFQVLCQSVRQLGMVKPLIIAPSGLIIAGHQRLRSLIATGATTAPVFIVQTKNIDIHDEAMFNQLHNGTDLDHGDEDVRVPPCTGTGYYDVPGTSVTGNLRAKGAAVRSEISKLIVGHGLWGGIVVNQSGRCLSGAQYALVCKVLQLPVRTYYVPDDQTDRVLDCFRRQYGRFSYAHLKVETFVQTFAQPSRVNVNKPDPAQRHPSWVSWILPAWQPGEHVLDFGCGHGVFLKELARDRPDFPVWGLEFFFRRGEQLDTRGTHAMIDALFDHMRTHGRFDIILCDWVINSVDRQAAEVAVMTCLNAFLKPGGWVLISGRRREIVDDTLKNLTRHAGYHRGVEFFDEYGLSGVVRKGHWFYQKYHTEAQAIALGTDYIGSKVTFHPMAQRWRIKAWKDKELPDAQIEAALRYEFDLPWPNDHRVGRAADAVAAWRAMRAQETR